MKLVINAILFLAFHICYAQSDSRLFLLHDATAETISAFRNKDQLVLTQNIKKDTRPYIHPIMAPDGNGVLTEFSPEHHKHQTGIYWGLKKVNGRDYFMNWKSDYWRHVSSKIIEAKGPQVKWKLTYDLIDETGNAIIRETQTWTLQEQKGKYLLDLEWQGEAKADVTMEKFYVGGLFVRMPWYKGIDGEVINSDEKRNNEAEGQRARWNDIGLKIIGRDDKAHIAILDYHGNTDSPVAWRVDNELGVGPSRQIVGDWSLKKGAVETIKYRLVIYTGDFRKETLDQLWETYSKE